MRPLATLLISLSPLTALGVDIGPFTITGFAKAEVSMASNQCASCQRFPNEARHRPWADELAQGVPYGKHGASLTLFQPYISTKEFDLGRGFKAKALISQRWRDGRQDIAGVWYEKTPRSRMRTMVWFRSAPSQRAVGASPITPTGPIWALLIPGPPVVRATVC